MPSINNFDRGNVVRGALYGLAELVAPVFINMFFARSVAIAAHLDLNAFFNTAMTSVSSCSFLAILSSVDKSTMTALHISTFF